MTNPNPQARPAAPHVFSMEQMTAPTAQRKIFPLTGLNHSKIVAAVQAACALLPEDKRADKNEKPSEMRKRLGIKGGKIKLG